MRAFRRWRSLHRLSFASWSKSPVLPILHLAWLMCWMKVIMRMCRALDVLWFFWPGQGCLYLSTVWHVVKRNALFLPTFQCLPSCVALSPCALSVWFPATKWYLWFRPFHNRKVSCRLPSVECFSLLGDTGIGFSSSSASCGITTHT